MYFIHFLRSRFVTCYISGKMTRQEVITFPTFHVQSFNKLFRHLSYSSSEEFDFNEKLTSRYQIDFQAVTQGCTEKLNALKVLLLNLELKVQRGMQLPKVINTKHWRVLLELTDDEILSYFQYRFAVETLNEIEAKENHQNLKYFEHNRSKTLFDETILEQIPRLYDANLMLPLFYGPYIFIDCSFEKIIPRYLIWSTAYHMFEAWLKNRVFSNPSHIIYCNLNPNGELFSLIMEMFTDTNHDPTLSFNWTKYSYLDYFSNEELIYLSPDSKYEMNSYNYKKNYIIGGLSNFFHTPVTYQKAKSEEIQTAKFPIDKYVDWGWGPKKLTINNCINVLNELKEGCGWNVAFRHIPKDKWARHAMDEKRTQQFPCYKRPTELIHQKYRDAFIKKLSQ